MNDLIIIIPLLLLIVFWIALAHLRREPLKASTHFGLAATLIILAVFGLWTMANLSSGGAFSGLALYGWISYSVPAGVMTYLLAVAGFTLFRSVRLRLKKERGGKVEKDVPPSRKKVMLSFVFIALLLVIIGGGLYVEHLESKFGQKTTESNIRDLYRNPIVTLFPYLRARLARQHHIPLDLLAKLFDDSNQNVRWSACLNDRASHELIRKAYKSSWSRNKECVLVNRNAPADLLRELSGDDDESIRNHVARHKNTPPDILMVLSKDESKYVQGSVANNPATPGEALTWLVKSDDYRQRANIATHVNAPISLLEQLAKDNNTFVRLQVLSRVQLPRHIIDTLVNDKNEEVSAQALAKRKLIMRQR